MAGDCLKCWLGKGLVCQNRAFFREKVAQWLELPPFPTIFEKGNKLRLEDGRMAQVLGRIGADCGLRTAEAVGGKEMRNGLRLKVALARNKVITISLGE